MNRTRAAFLLFVVAGCAAGCGGAGGDGTEKSDMAISGDGAAAVDMTKKPDMACANTGAGDVGAACKSASDCSGCKPTCSQSLSNILQAAIPAPDGYCSGTCKKDADCGNGGYCQTQLGYCLQPCAAKGDCTGPNDKNHCFALTQTEGACLPIPADCNPTSPASCNNTGACFRTLSPAAIDDVGDCLTPCTIGMSCPPDSTGAAQACYFLNLRINGQGAPTGDFYAGLGCFFDGSLQEPAGGKPDTACMYLNSCINGYECDFYGAKLCKPLCRDGMNDCQKGTCTNAFKLSVFTNGDIGLCL